MDIRQYFDSIDREQLMQFLEMRIGDQTGVASHPEVANAGVLTRR